jgi:hypothetical protein
VTTRAVATAALVMSCASPRPFPLREPMLVDTDLRPVSIACRRDPGSTEPRTTCAPREYVSPFVWDHLDNLVFARLSRALSLDVAGEAVNLNSLDEVPDSAWFTNRPWTAAAAREVANQRASGACKPDDLLPPPDEVPDRTWVIDHGKDNGSTAGFRITVPEKGVYMLKADDPGKPERASAASVIGAAFYHAVGFNTTCEQVVAIRKSELVLTPHLKVVDNDGVSHPFDDAALDKVLTSTTQLPGHRVRMQASKWLPGVAIGPFRYVGTRPDDPNDVIDHADRRELRGSRLLSAWLDHWDAREQNSMDVWMASDAQRKRSSPGHVVHYIIDTSDAFGGEVSVAEMSRRLGYSYTFDAADIARSMVTFGIEERPWDRARQAPGRGKFGFYRVDDFDPDDWKPMYPNPAFLRMTERDGAWMARLIARFSIGDIRRIVALGAWSDPSDAEYLTQLLVQRQRKILARYLGVLSPLGEIHAPAPDQVCATDFARLRELAPASAFRYTAIERGGGRSRAVRAEAGADGVVCVRTQPLVAAVRARLGSIDATPDGDPARRVTIEIRNGTASGPLVIHAYDLGGRGMRVAGATRPEA